MSKEVFSPSEIWMVASLNLSEKHTGSFFSSLKQQVWFSFCVFWKKQAACHFCLGSHMTVVYHLIRIATGMAVSIHRTLSPDLFSDGISYCIIGVSSLLCSETAGKYVFWNLGTGVQRQKKYFPTVKPGYLQACQENTLVYFSLHYNNRFGQYFEFSEYNRLLGTSFREVIWQYSFT